MAFFVYLFVLLVAAGSVIFGLDLTQAPLQPPTYATVTNGAHPNDATTQDRTAKTAAPVGTREMPAPVLAKAEPEALGVAAARAQVTPEDGQTPPPATTAAGSAPAHCAIDACAAAYRSFRASDCTYQPFGGERRLCTKSVTTKKITAARTPVHQADRTGDIRRVYDRRYAERDNSRDSYAEPRRGWAFDLFGDAFGH